MRFTKQNFQRQRLMFPSAYLNDNSLHNFRYFEALSKGEPLPVKDRLEVPVGSALERPVTKGFIEVLHKQVLTESPPPP